MERYDWDRGYARGPAGGRYGGEYGRGFAGRWSGRFQGGEGWFRGERGGFRGYDRGVYGDEYPGFNQYGRGAYDEGFGRYRGGGGRGGAAGWGSQRHDQSPLFGGGRQRGGGFGEREPGGGSWGVGWNEAGWGGGPRGGGRGGGWNEAGWGGGGRAGGRGGERAGGWGGRGYDSAYADEPFMPDEAYLRHPEYDRPQRHLADRWPGSAAGGQGGYELVDDEEIRQAVRQNLFQDNWVDAERLEVEVEDGVVTLSGEVDDFLEARYAWDDAWETSGVRGVVNHIHVRVEGPAGEHDSMVQSTGSKAKGKAKNQSG
jgi:hypothetical protein